MVRLFTYAPAIGLIGLALYQLLNQHDLISAAHTIGQAATVFGIGAGVHAFKTSTAS